MAMFRAATLATSARAAMDLTLLPENKYGDGGRCLDGSMAAYYYEAPTSGNSNSWVVYLKGGGACHDEDACAKRAKTPLGSSKSYAATMKGAGLYSTDPSANPDFFDAHHVFVPYCTGDVHAGQVVTPGDAQWGFYFSGHLNLVHILDHLYETVPGIRQAKELLLTGSSAGGMGTILNCDWLQSALSEKGSHAKVKCGPMAGWFFPGFTEDQSDEELPPSDWAHWSIGQSGGMDGSTQDLYQTYLHDDCVKAHSKTDAWKCGSASNVYPFIKTPMYVMENQYDTNQLSAQLGLPRSEYSSDAGKGYIAYFGRAMRNSTALIVNHPFGKTGDGLYLPSCLDHGINAQKTRLKGYSNFQGLGDWYYGRTGVPTVLVDDCEMQAPGLPCNPTCDSVPGGDTGTCKAELQQLCGDTIGTQPVQCGKCARSFQAELLAADCTEQVVRDICKGKEVIV